MKRFLILVMGLGIMMVMRVAAQDAAQSTMDDRHQSREDGLGKTQALSDAQKAQIKAILSKYNASTLTADQAKAIHEAFRQAGVRGGPSINDAVKAAGFDPDKLRDLAPPPGKAKGENVPQPEARRDKAKTENGNGAQSSHGNGRKDAQGQGQYSIEQAVSDRAQLNTIAFDGLAFLTGDFGCNTFLPPGKVADFSGFQYMRDVDSNKLGHNTSFVPRAANNILYILTNEQKAKLISLALEQEKMLADFVQKRFPLIKAFTRQLNGDIPSGSVGLNREAVMKYTAALYEIDGTLSYRRAEVLGGIIRTLTDKQKEYLSKMSFKNSATWSELADQIDKKSMSPTAHVAVMTYASEMFSWYAGNVEADVYFCPERHATYFGSFYMKDIPAMGNANFSISTSLTGDNGEAFLATLTATQRMLVTSLVDQQKEDLNKIVNTRRAIATELRQFMKESSIDKEKVKILSQKYGELDGEISYFYSMAFAQVAKTLTADQKTALLKLRNLDAKYACKGAYLYSQAIGMPTVPNSDFLFAVNAGTKQTSAVIADSGSLANTGFVLQSTEVPNGGILPKEITGDGTSSTLPLEWSGAPAGTKSYAVIMHHVDPEQKTKWYWILYDIPADTKRLPKNVKGVGILGNNSINGKTEYAPPHSKGPGAKTYVYTVYALSAPVKIMVKPTEVTRDVLLAAMKNSIIATAQLSVVYSRTTGMASAAEDVQKR